MKRTWLILLPLLLLGACLPKDEVLQSYYSYGMVHVDSLGQAEILPLPAISLYSISLERLPDGRVLIVHDSLHIYNPKTQELTEITPAGNYSYFRSPAHDLSPDGTWLYHPKFGSIRRLNLIDFSSEQVVVAGEDSYVRPVASKDGRYLTYLRSGDGIYATEHTGGYPLIRDLLTGETTSLASGSSITDKYITYAWKALNTDQVYYISSGYLMTMDMQGNNRNVIRSNISFVSESYNGRFLLCLESQNYSGSRLIYRDNQSLTWTGVPSMGNYQLCREANVVFSRNGGNLSRLDLESGQQTTVFTNRLQGRMIYSITGIAPSWNGKDVVAFVTFLDWKKDKYPL